MKTQHRARACRLLVVLSVLLASLCSAPAWAGGLHISGSVGYLSTKQNEIDNDHGNFAGTATVGVEVLELVLATIYAEFERTELLDEGKWNDQDYSYKADGIFLAARTLGPVYLVGRAGYIKAKFGPEMRTVAGERDEAISLGFGYDAGLRNELLLTHIEHEGGGETNMISFLIGF